MTRDRSIAARHTVPDEKLIDIINKGPGNDSTRPFLSGDFGRDGFMLKQKWNMNDHTYNLWAQSFGGIAKMLIDGVTVEAKHLAFHMDAIPAATAGSLGLIDAFFAWNATLPEHEALFVLDECARHFNLTIRNLKEKKNGT